jgi:signal transduction histidine kinase
MSLFWRVTAGFAFAILITIFTQRLVYSGFSQIPTFQIWTISGSKLVAREGENAFEALNRSDMKEARSELQVMNNSGLRSWLITPAMILGDGTPPSAAKARALAVYDGREREGLYLGYRIGLVHDGSKTAALLMLLPGLDSPWEVAGRLTILLGIPLVFCFGFACHIARPIEMVCKVASDLAIGKLSSRAAQTGGSLEVRRLGHAINQLADKLEASRTAQKRLLADLSHEIRSPLGRLLLASEMLDKSKGDPTKYHAQIARDVKRLNELVESLAYVVHPREQPSTFERLDLAEIAASVIEGTTIEAEEKGVFLKSQLSPTVIQGNPSVIFSAMENLVRNAIFHAPRGTAIDLIVAPRPETVQVLDRGTGVPEAYLSQIFEPFFRHSDGRERDTGGLGLGLAIVQAAMADHSGRATASLRPEGGLVVTLLFPDFSEDFRPGPPGGITAS